MERKVLNIRQAIHVMEHFTASALVGEPLGEPHGPTPPPPALCFRPASAEGGGATPRRSEASLFSFTWFSVVIHSCSMISCSLSNNTCMFYHICEVILFLNHIIIYYYHHYFFVILGGVLQPCRLLVVRYVPILAFALRCRAYMSTPGWESPRFTIPPNYTPLSFRSFICYILFRYYLFIIIIIIIYYYIYLFICLYNLLSPGGGATWARDWGAPPGPARAEKKGGGERENGVYIYTYT